eukprot:10783345-Prorocentrum_lima.AAC.1
MWDSGASLLLLPLTNFPKNASGTSRAMVILEVRDTQAIYWNDEVFCKEGRTPLIPANKVVQTLDLVVYV